MDNFQVTVATAIIGLIIVILVWFIQLRGPKSPNSKPTYLILGTVNLGKTLLFYKWDVSEQDTEPVVTVSLIDANYGTINLPISRPQIQKSFQLIDYPGHLKYFNLLQKLILEEITLHKVKGVVFVIDSSQFKQSAHSVAKYLFNLLSITERLHNGVDVLFAVNKSDLFDSTPVLRVRQILEEEISGLIHNELTAIDKNSDENDDPIGIETLREFWLGVVGSKQAKFTFDKLEGNMDFLAGSVTKDNVELWENWLDERVVN